MIWKQRASDSALKTLITGLICDHQAAELLTLWPLSLRPIAGISLSQVTAHCGWGREKVGYTLHWPSHSAAVSHTLRIGTDYSWLYQVRTQT